MIFSSLPGHVAAGGGEVGAQHAPVGPGREDVGGADADREHTVGADGHAGLPKEGGSSQRVVAGGAPGTFARRKRLLHWQPRANLSTAVRQGDLPERPATRGPRARPRGGERKRRRDTRRASLGVPRGRPAPPVPHLGSHAAGQPRPATVEGVFGGAPGPGASSWGGRPSASHSAFFL